MSTIRKVVFSSIGASLGIFAFFATQSIMKDSFAPLMEACAKAPQDMAEFEKVYHPYQPWLGGKFVCIITQFIHDLVSSYPAGMFLWMTTMTTFFPMIVLLLVEAGRSGVKGGPVLYPTVILLLGQLLGISVIFPLIWVPAYIFGRDTPKGSVHILLALVAILCLAPAAVLSVLAFHMHPNDPNWTWVAGLLGGPVMALVPLVVWTFKPPPVKDSEPDEVYAVSNSYSTAGALSFIFWAGLVFTIFKHYGLDHRAFVGDLWANANDSVKFMAIDSLVLYLGMLTYIAYIRVSAAGEVILQTVLFGPGAACAMAMAQLEMDRCPNIVDSAKKDK